MKTGSGSNSRMGTDATIDSPDETRTSYLYGSDQIAPTEIRCAVVLSVICAVMLFLTVLKLPYGYYTLLRWIVTATALLWVHIVFFRPKLVWLWGFAVVAIVFNPLIPMHIRRATWLTIDFVTGLLMVATVIATVLIRRGAKK